MPQDQVRDAVQGMSGKIQSQHFLFHGHEQPGVVFRDVRPCHGRSRGGGLRRVKQGKLAFEHAATGLVHGIDDEFVLGHETGTENAEGVEGAASDEAFHRFLVQITPGEPFAEIHEIPVGSFFLPFRNQRLHHIVAHIADGGQSEPDVASYRHKCFPAFIDIRRQNADAHLPGFQNVFGHLREASHEAVHQGRHEGNRMIMPQPGRLVSHHRIGGRMGLVEGVGREVHHFVEQLIRCFFIHAVAQRTGDEHLAGFIGLTVNESAAFRVHHFFFLLRHGPANQVRAPQGITGDVPDNLHYLFLVDHAAVGDVQDGLQQRMRIGHKLRAVLGADVPGYLVHGARPVKRNAGNDVLKGSRLQIFHEVGHALAFKLEHTPGFTPANHGVYGQIVHGDAIDVDVLTGGFPRHFHRVANDGECTQGQKIHFQQAKFLDGVHGELGGDEIAIAIQRYQIGNGFSRDHHASRMGGRMSGHALERFCRIEQFRNAWILRIHTGQILAHADGLLNGEVSSRHHGNHLGNPVHIAVWHGQRPPHVTHGSPGSHRSKCDDLRHAIRAVLGHHIVDDLLPAFVTKIDVDIRHADAFRIEKAFKDEVVPNGIHTGDAQAVGYDAAGCRTAPGTHHDALLPGVTDEVPDDEEIVDISHLPDDREFEPRTFLMGGILPVSPGIALPGESLQQGALCVRRRDRESRQVQLSEQELHLASLRNALCVAQGFRHIPEMGGHLCR